VLHEVASNTCVALVLGFQVVLRIRADDPTAKMQFGSKYGVGMKAVPRLLQVAKVLGLRIAGGAWFSRDPLTRHHPCGVISRCVRVEVVWSRVSG
jgi:hypothetical protein